MSGKKQKRLALFAVLLLFAMAGALIPWIPSRAAPDEKQETEGELSEEEQESFQEEVKQKILSQFDFEEINLSLAELFPEDKLNFTETVYALIQGDLKPSGDLLIRLVQDQISYEFRYNKSALVHILLIAVFAAVFSNFSGTFQNKQVSEISFYVLYLLLLTVCLNSFRLAMGGVEDRLEMLLEFMRVLTPTYFLAVAVASGTTTSLVFYDIVLMLIYVVELVIMNVLMPLIHIYIMAQVLNYLSKEDYLSQLTELIQKVIVWSLKTLLGCIIGLNVVQGILSPAIDTLQRSMLTKSAQAIPGIGNAIGGLTDVVLGTAVVIKNGIGMAGAIVCIAICAVPLLQMAVMAVLYKLMAAIVQPVSDKRIVGCISGISEGAELLVRVIFTTGMLFLVTVAIVTASTT